MFVHSQDDGHLSCPSFGLAWKAASPQVHRVDLCFYFSGVHIQGWNALSFYFFFFSNPWKFHLISLKLSLFFFFFKILFLERGEGREKERETSMCGCLSHAPYLGPGLQLRHVPWLGIELVTLWFAGQCSIHWATPARVHRFTLINLIHVSDHMKVTHL